VAKSRSGTARSHAAGQEPEAGYRSIETRAFEPGPRARAILRGVEIAKEDLRRSGGTFDLNAVRTLLNGVSRQRIDKRIEEGSLLALQGPSNVRRFPVIQFMEDGRLVEGLKEVQEALPSRNPWAVLNFLIHEDARLDGRTPIDLLKGGEVDLVVEAARRVAEQGA